MTDVVLTIGLGYGDEGKGSVIDYLARHYAERFPSPPINVRFSGGAQTAHNVVTSDGRHHTFSQIGSGTFVPGVRTHLSRHVLVNPINLLEEEHRLRASGVEDVFERMTIERDALVTTPFQIAANRLREIARGQARHGSCGMGIGETVADSITLGDMAPRVSDLEDLDIDKLKGRLGLLQALKREQLRSTFERLEDEPSATRPWATLTDPSKIESTAELMGAMIRRVTIVDETYLQRALQSHEGAILFEGAQGVLLDQDFGTFPYVTRCRTTFVNALELLQEAGVVDRPVRRVGILRSYMTRHGAGPFVTEDPELAHPELHNAQGPWQGGWRQGHLDLVALNYAVRAAGGVSELAVTHMDRVKGSQKWCWDYEPHFRWDLPRHTEERDRLIELERITQILMTRRPSYCTYQPEELMDLIEAEAQAPITLTSHGPTAEDKRACR